MRIGRAVIKVDFDKISDLRERANRFDPSTRRDAPPGPVMSFGQRRAPVERVDQHADPPGEEHTGTWPGQVAGGPRRLHLRGRLPFRDFADTRPGTREPALIRQRRRHHRCWLASGSGASGWGGIWLMIWTEGGAGGGGPSSEAI